jgi:adsorption protein B
MALRDRHGPLTAIVLAAAYLLVVIWGVLWLARAMGWRTTLPAPPSLTVLLWITGAACVWRAVWRFGFIMREYGAAEGLRSVFRLFVANFIAILAGRRALFAYMRTLRGEKVHWEKTPHSAHPAAKAVAS